MNSLPRTSMLALLLSALVACAAPPPAPTATPAQPAHVKLAMGYIPNVQFAPFYVAAEKGYFRDAGIDIEFVTMFENDSTPLVGTNELQFANVSAEQVLQARAQGLPLVYVAAWYQQFPIVLVAKKSLGIETPADLRGHTIGLPGLFGASYVGVRAMLNSAGVAESDVTLQSIGFTQVDAFLAGQSDIVVGYANNEPIQLEAQGQDITVLPVANYVPLAGNGLATNETTVAENPALVRAMVSVLVKGLEDTIADPDEAFEISKKYVEGLESADAAAQDVQRQVLAESIELWKAGRLGLADPAKFEQTQQTLLGMGLLAEPLDLSQAFTNEFVP